MRKKHSFLFVRNHFENEGYELLSKQYVSNSIKLKYRCPYGHIDKITFNSWKDRNSRCPTCARKKKHTTDEIEKEFEKEKYILLSKNYINAFQKLSFICPNNHIHKISWNCWQRGQRCGKCNGGIKLNFKVIEDAFKKVNYKLLTKQSDYKNTRQKLKFICQRQHTYYISYDVLRRGHRCLKCYLEDKWKDYSEYDLQQLDNYRINIWQQTQYNFNKYKEIINPFKFKRGHCNYHIDHIYSVINGFNNNIPVKIIASPINLQMLYYKDNHKKYSTSLFTKEQLYELYYQFHYEVNLKND